MKLLNKLVQFFVVIVVLFSSMSGTQAAFTTYTNEATWQAAVGSHVTEDFNSTATSTFSDPFQVSGFNGFCLSGPTAGDTIGIMAGSGGGNIDGSNYLGWLGGADGPTINYNFSSTVTAFGFQWRDTDPTDIWNVKVDGTTFEDPPFKNGTGTGFFGLISDTPFSLASMEQTAAGGVINNFGVDLVRSNATGGGNYLPSILNGAIIAVTMDEDSTPTAFSLTLNASDCDGDTITWSIGSPASNGTASVSGTGASKAISYTPSPNYSGSDSFRVRVSDATGGTESIINVTITAAPNAAPVASSVSVNGTLAGFATLTAGYTYSDSDIDLEGSTSFRWLRSDDASGTNKAAISGATNSTYVLASSDIAKYISVEVTPRALTGVLTGTAVESSLVGPVTKASQVITGFSASPGSGLFGGSSTLSAVTDAPGLTVLFGSNTIGVCTVSGNTVSYIRVGTCTVTANQAGDANYNPAPQVTLDIIVPAYPVPTLSYWGQLLLVFLLMLVIFRHTRKMRI